MRESSRRLNYYIFIFVSGALCLLYALLFRPITYEAQGDFPEYLDLARQIFVLPGATDTDLSHRSPLYSIILGFFIILFGETHYLIPLIAFQYFLIFLSSLMVYKIIRQLSGNHVVAFIAALAGILNLTTIFFGYMVLTETLALFLLTLTVWLIVKHMKEGVLLYSVAAGLTTGLLILARFNTLGLPLAVVLIFFIVAVVRPGKASVLKKLSGLGVYAAGVLLIVNIWALRNYSNSGTYEILPRHHAGQRWAVPGTISKENKVSGQYEPILDIFLETREKLIAQSETKGYRKGSLLGLSPIKRINDYFTPDVSGYLMYRDSEKKLLAFYNIEESAEGIRLLSNKLKPFYDEIAAQNKGEIKKLRVYSLLYSFKHISPTLPGSEPVNLNHLPRFMLQFYKAIFMLVVVLTYLFSAADIIRMLSDREKLAAGSQRLMVYAFIWYFPAVNFYANVLGDANRFRYPSDLIIIGLFVFFIWQINGNRLKTLENRKSTE